MQKLILVSSFVFFLAKITFSQMEPRLVLPVGHLGGVTKLDCSPNEKLILTEDLNSDIIIIDSDKLIELQRHNYGNWKITSSTFLNDSSVISICNDTLVAVWNFYTDKVDLYTTTVPLNKVYVEKHGLYCINNQGIVFRFEISERQLILKKIIEDRANEIYFKSEKEIFLVNGKKLLFIDLNHKKQFKHKFDNQITAICWNNIGNVLLGFDNGEIKECDSSLNVIHNYISISDRISVINYIGDSTIISGSYDFSVVTQNKKEILNSTLLDDWTVGMIMKNREIITCTWNGMISSINDKLEIQENFETSLKKATFFCQRGSSLFISYNDGDVCHFDLNTYKLINSYHINRYPILGLDISFDATELIIWNSNGVCVFNTNEKRIKFDFKKNNIVSAKFIPNTSKYIFCSAEFFYFFNDNQILDSIPLIDSWSIIETKDNSMILSGLNRIIEISHSGNIVKDLINVGQIWTSQKNKNNFFLGTSNGDLFYLNTNQEISKILNVPMGIDGIEVIDKNKIIFNCENGQLIETDIKTKKRRIIADTKQDYGSWDFKYNYKSGMIVYPNSKIWNYKMDVDVLDLDGNLLNKLENVGGEVVCISNPNKSIEFNDLDSNQVIFIVSDGSIKLWDIDKNGDAPITKLGFDYYNLLNNELKDFNLNGAFLKSGLLKLPIPGVDTLTYMNLKNGDWLVHDSKYRFDGTPGAIDKLYFTCGLEIVELNQVKDSLYVPNLVQRYMNGETLEHLPQIKDLQICGYTPYVEPIDSLNYKIIPRKGGVGEVAVFINGIQRLSYESNNLQLKDEIYHLGISKKDIDFFRETGKRMQIKVIAKTADNSVSSRGVIVEVADNQTQTQLKPSIHAIMIGVDDYKDNNLDLNYAAKDANDLHQALEQASKKFFNVDDTNRVFFYNLTINREGKLGTDKIKGKTPDKANINQTLEEIEKKSKPEDILLVFFAGHGEIVDKDQLLLLTTEASSTNFEGIRMRELLEQLNKIPAGKRVLILDACHSGAAINNMDMAQLTGKRDVKDAERQSQRLKELDKLASKSGFAIITASSSDQKALELPQYEHGLMTYALLNAMLNNKSSLDENNQLQLDKWLMATEEEVKKLNQNQSAERMVPVTFTLGKIDDEVRSSIVLKEIPTVFVDNVLNKNTFNDNLKIKYMLSSAFQEMSRGTDTQIMVADFPNAVKVNILYEEKDDELKANISLYKENFEQKFELTGKKDNISAFVQELMNQIRTKIQK